LGVCAGNVHVTGQGETAGLQNIPHVEVRPASGIGRTYKKYPNITKGIGDLGKKPRQLVKYLSGGLKWKGC
jgi:hypothetical protein